MLYIHESTRENLDKALKFAFKVGKEHELLSQLYRMGEGWGRNKPYVCFLYNDFAPYSFTFSCYKLEDCQITEDRGEPVILIKPGTNSWMNGGLIYHGPLEDGSHAETFSVQLTPNDGWSIHT